MDQDNRHGEAENKANQSVSDKAKPILLKNKFIFQVHFAGPPRVF